MSATVLTQEQLEHLAEQLAEKLAPRIVEQLAPVLAADADAPGSLVDATTLAKLLGVSRETVYEHRDELGARRIGTGNRPRLRFDVSRALAAWDQAAQIATAEPEPATQTTSRQHSRKRPERTRAGAPLLEVKGRAAA